MNYLVPLDFSDPSKNATEYAAALNKIWSGNVHLSHIIVPLEEEPSYLPVKTLHIKQNTVFELFNCQENLRKNHGIRSSCDMLSGEITRQINKTARKEKSNLILIGMQGSSGLRKFLYGSNAMAIIQEATIPVLALPDSSSFAPYQNIIYYTDYDVSEIENIRSLAKISRKFEGTLSIVSINNKIETGVKSEFKNMVQTQNSFATIYFRDLQEDEPDIAEGLLQFVLREGADLIGISKNHSTLVRSMAGRNFTGEFVFQAEVPVLFFPRS
jgi:nucleotide-binding universal stress UspA family protein